jgi:hypothetical protein
LAEEQKGFTDETTAPHTASWQPIVQLLPKWTKLFVSKQFS